MLNCFAMRVTRLQNEKKFLLSCKQVTMYFLEFQRINTFHTLCQGYNSQCFCRGSFQLGSLAMKSKRKLLNDSIVDYFKKI